MSETEKLEILAETDVLVVGAGMLLRREPSLNIQALAVVPPESSSRT